MFAVPGWSVSADKLKPELPTEENEASSGGKGKKRKRPASKVEVTPENFADLWDKVIEDKGAVPPKDPTDKSSAKEERRKAKKRRKTKDGGGDVSGNKSAELGAAGELSVPLKEKSAKKEKRKNKSGEMRADGERPSPAAKVTEKGNERSRKPKDSEGKPKSSKKADEPPLDTSKQRKTDSTGPKNHEGKTMKLTPLQASMREKLVSARFRHLNETLYTRPSADAFQLFQDDPGMFEDYHAGFRHQVDVWPENPVDGYIRDIILRGRVKGFIGKKHAGQLPPTPSAAQQQQQQLQPLPRIDGTSTIADLGCGDARLAAALQPHLHKLHLRVLSYDLHSPSPLVTRADIARLPLRDGSVDVAIFCLALMGTNWLNFVEEAYRVLRWKGELWVAEIKSRFGPTAGAGKKNGPGKQPVAHSVGARKKHAPPVAAKGGKAGVATNDDAADLAVEVDGAEDRRRETDVSAFVEALRRRGFVLGGSDGGDGSAARGAVDLSNKMFVKMNFVKAAPAVRGKGVQTKMKWPGSGAGAAAKMKTGWGAENEVGEDEEDREKAILKPCVYKLR